MADRALAAKAMADGTRTPGSSASGRAGGDADPRCLPQIQSDRRSIPALTAPSAVGLNLWEPLAGGGLRKRDPAGVDGGLDRRTGGRSTAVTLPGRLRRPGIGPAWDREWPRRSGEAELGRSTGTESRLQPVGLVPRRAATNGERSGWKFTEVGAAAGVQLPSYSFPTWFFDFDNDGWEDLFVGAPADRRSTPGQNQPRDLVSYRISDSLSSSLQEFVRRVPAALVVPVRDK